MRVALDLEHASSAHACPARRRAPRSLRARSTSIRCSARSFSSADELARERVVLGAVRPRGRVPAIGRSAGDAVRGRARRGSRARRRRAAVPPRSQEEHVRRRVDGPQRAVDGHRRARPSGAGGAARRRSGRRRRARCAPARCARGRSTRRGRARRASSGRRRSARSTGSTSSGTGPSRRRAISSASASCPGCAITWSVRRTWSKATTTGTSRKRAGRRDVAVAPLRERARSARSGGSAS